MISAATLKLNAGIQVGVMSGAMGVASECFRCRSFSDPSWGV